VPGDEIPEMNLQGWNSPASPACCDLQYVSGEEERLQSLLPGHPQRLYLPRNLWAGFSVGLTQPTFLQPPAVTSSDPEPPLCPPTNPVVQWV